MKDLKTEILIVGGGVGGAAAALAACSAGRRVILAEETDWLGGQFTAQATPPDEHGWIERFGSTRRYREFRGRVREFYRRHYPLTERARANEFLNPGDGWVSPLCAEPKVFLAVFEELLREYVGRGNLLILRETIAVAAETAGNVIEKIVLRSIADGAEIAVTADYFVDATELGELLPLTGTDYATGSEARGETGEPSAREKPDGQNSQAFSACFAVSYHEGEDHTIERPSGYAFWRDFVPEMRPPWSGKLLSLTGLSPRTLAPVDYRFAPHDEPNKAFAGLWTYRRILHRENFADGAFDSDITLVNYPQIDYLLGDLLNASSEDEKLEIIDEAKEQSLSFLYFLQTQHGLRGLKLRPDVVGTADGLAKSPYIREARRIKAEFTIVEQHVSAQLRAGEKFAEKFADSVGIGFYQIDLHPTRGGDNYVDVEALPFQIPLGALIPRKTENLLPACKNIGTTHITNGCYRLHPVEWNIGEAVGSLLAFCLQRNRRPREVRNDAKLLAEFQDELNNNGFELDWREDLVLEDGDPHRHAM